MKKSIFWFLFLPSFVTVSVVFSDFLAAFQGRGQLEEPEDRPEGRASLRIAVEQIQLDVTVQDKDGNLIQGLQKEHFRVYEDKVLQDIGYFEPVEGPMTAVILTEYSKVIPWEWLYEAWLGSHIFLEQMRPDDWVAAMAYDIRPEILVDFTQNKGQVMNALRRLNYPAYSESNLYDALYDVLDRVQEVEGKVAVILISSGLDTFSKNNLDQILDKVKQSNAVIYPVSLGGQARARYDHRYSNTTRMNLYQADAALKAFAKHTGGTAFFPRFVQAHRGIFEAIAGLLRNQYSLGYVSTNTKKDGKFRKLKVEVVADSDGDGKPDDKLKVQHRDGYLVEKS